MQQTHTLKVNVLDFHPSSLFASIFFLMKFLLAVRQYVKGGLRHLRRKSQANLKTVDIQLDS